jgi:4-amino-4-deoxy-L-arabinose transferase-like glycosyltransferase
MKYILCTDLHLNYQQKQKSEATCRTKSFDMMEIASVNLRDSVIVRLAGRFSTSFWIFLTTFIVYLVLAVVQAPRDWSTMAENSYVAASVARGHGFSSPYLQPTGPSALVPPLFPYLLAGIFSVFGVLSHASYMVAVGVNIFLHASSCVLLYWIGRETFGHRIGLYAALGLGCFPLLAELFLRFAPGAPLLIPPNLVWNTHLTEFVILLLIWLTVRQVNWFVYGAVWGVAALTNPTVLALVPAFWGWRMRERLNLRHLGMGAVALALCLAPWLIRNYLVFNQPVFIRDGLGIELRVGNQPGQKGLWDGDAHPASSKYELSRFAQMGELEYAKASQREVMASIRSRPLEFVGNTIRRVGYFWVGPPAETRRLRALVYLKYVPALVFVLLAFYGAIRAVQSGNRSSHLLFAVLIFYPLVHYLTHTSNCLAYQYPIQAEMLLLAMSALFFRMTTSVERNGRSVQPV